MRVPPEPPRGCARERDAGYVDDADAEEDGDAQIEMERDMAARGSLRRRGTSDIAR